MKNLYRQLIRERVVMAVILLNAIAVFLHAFQSFPGPLRDTLYWIDYACTIYFVVEISMKIGQWGWPSFWDDGWNRFDFVVVALSLPLLLSPTPFLSLDSYSAILLLRLGRLIRLLRLFYFIPNQREIQKGIVRALQASIGVFLAIFLYMFALTLFSYSFFHTYAPSYFGDPLRSMYSMFQIFTVEGWYEIPNQISEQAGWPVGAFAQLYFAFVVLTGGILGLSLANAVFVDEMVVDNTKPLEEDITALEQRLNQHMDQSQTQREELATLITELRDQLDEDQTDEQ